MSSKLFVIIFLFFVIFSLLKKLDIAWPNPTEIVNLLYIDLSVSQNIPSKIGNVACTSKSVVFNENGTTMPSQWCNSCVNYHQYKALIYPKHIPDTYLDMVIFIPSQHGDTSFQRRQFLRKFPLNSTYFPQLKMRHVFVFGKFSIFFFFFFGLFSTSLIEPVNYQLSLSALSWIIIGIIIASGAPLMPAPIILLGNPLIPPIQTLRSGSMASLNYISLNLPNAFLCFPRPPKNRRICSP